MARSYFARSCSRIISIASYNRFFGSHWEDAGLSFVWTGDGRPDELSAKYGKGADVFVSEGTVDTPFLSGLKVGAPAELWEYTIDIYHTLYYAAGYLFKQAQPRMAVINHYESGGPALEAESMAEVRAHWDGLFMFGGPDVECLAKCNKSSSFATWKSIRSSTIRRMPIASPCRSGPVSS